MTEDEIKKKAKEKVLEVHPEATGFRITVTDDFFSGAVAMTDYTDGPKTFRDFVYFNESGKVQHYQSIDSFIKAFTGRKSDRLTAILYGFGGLLAMTITGTVCYIAATQPKVPEVLSGALTLILGFYFGTFAAREKQK
jgi:hypothetical protein